MSADVRAKPALPMPGDLDPEGISPLLTPRWTPLFYHPVQHALWESKARFRVVPAGRRSGKTEIAKRFLILMAIAFHRAPDGHFFFAAPTLDQARRIYWDDVKALTPTWAIARNRYGRLIINETLMTIRLVNGATISVIGMDRPHRVEGIAIDGIVLDEYADMRSETWKEHIRPALSTPGRPGWAWFIGVPGGRNHYYKVYSHADQTDDPMWGAFTWKSAEVLDPAEVEAARADLDRMTFEQEYEAQFVSFEGRAYYAFDREVHAAGRVRYRDDLDLMIALDFNNKPGVLSVVQELPVPGWLRQPVPGLGQIPLHADKVTAFVDEVWIERNSNTYRVCDRFLEKYANHPGRLLMYGDPSGGAKLTSSVRGSDWDLADEKLRPYFGNRLKRRISRAHPPVRNRLNSVNARFEAANGLRSAVVDSKLCEHTIASLEGTARDEEGNIDKPSGDMVTHLGDALGYLMVRRHPCGGAERVKVTTI